MVSDGKNSGFQTTPMFLLEKLNQIYVDEQRTRKFESETKTQPNKQQPASLEQLNQPMKNTILRGLFAAALVLVSSSAFAQSAPVSAEASSSATIVQNIEIEKTGDLKFTTVAAGVAKTISTLGAVSFNGNGIADGQEQAASFEVSKAANIPVLLTVSGLTNLVSADGQLSTTYVVDAATALAGAADASFPAEGASRELQLTGALNTTLTQAGAIFVRIGGTVTPANNQVPNTYTGTITLTAAYN